MKLIALALFTGATAVAAVTPAQSTQPAKTRPPSFESTYGVIADRNPFLRERHKPRSAEDFRAARNAERKPTRTVAQSFILRGVAIEDDQLHAYLEDTRGGSAVRVAPGDPLGDGRVVDIAIDAIAYEAAGRTTWVQVGQDLTGSVGAASSGPPADAAPAASATQPSGVAPPPLPPGGGTLEERMKLRAAQQRGKR